MLTILSSPFRALWRRPFVRYVLIHTPLGILFSMLADHLVGVGVGRYWATALGYAPYILVGFFIDRLITYDSPNTSASTGVPAYFCSEGVTFLLTLLAVFVVIETGLSLAILATEQGQQVLSWCVSIGFEAEDPEYTIARGPFGLPFSGIVSFLLNRWVTFGVITRLFPKK